MTDKNGGPVGLLFQQFTMVIISRYGGLFIML